MIAILCTVTGYEATSPEANIDLQVDEKNPHVPERDSTDVSAGYDTFVAHDGAETDTQAKLIRIPCSAINVHKLENVFAMLGENEIAAVDEVFNENIEPVEETRVNFLRSATTMKSH